MTNVIYEPAHLIAYDKNENKIFEIQDIKNLSLESAIEDCTIEGCMFTTKSISLSADAGEIIFYVRREDIGTQTSAGLVNQNKNSLPNFSDKNYEEGISWEV